MKLTQTCSFTLEVTLLSQALFFFLFANLNIKSGATYPMLLIAIACAPATRMYPLSFFFAFGKSKAKDLREA